MVKTEAADGVDLLHVSLSAQREKKNNVFVSLLNPSSAGCLGDTSAVRISGSHFLLSSDLSLSLYWSHPLSSPSLPPPSLHLYLPYPPAYVRQGRGYVMLPGEAGKGKGEVGSGYSGGVWS